jgi:hypothetical protein
MKNAESRLRTFQKENGITTKGPLSMVIQFTRMAKERLFPLNSDDFQTSRKGQVSGLGGPNLKKILKEHGITRILSSEGGRTSRGSMGLMISYVKFLNDWNAEETIDFAFIEKFWASAIKEYFDNQPFTLSADASQTVTVSFDLLFDQAYKRQSENPGTQYLGALLQHLTAAKLSLILTEGTFEMRSASAADAVSAQGGDFVINKTVIHCTTAPGAPLIEKCVVNIKNGYRPVIITLFERVRTAMDLTSDAGLGGRVEVWSVQQFLSTNIHEHSLFDKNEQTATITEIIRRYNEIIDSVETDPSLRIDFEG